MAMAMSQGRSNPAYDEDMVASTSVEAIRRDDMRYKGNKAAPRTPNIQEQTVVHQKKTPKSYLLLAILSLFFNPLCGKCNQ